MTAWDALPWIGAWVSWCAGFREPGVAGTGGRTYLAQFAKPDAQGAVPDFWWTEGNGSCDCNRGRLLLSHDLPCGETAQILSVEPDPPWVLSPNWSFPT